MLFARIVLLALVDFKQILHLMRCCLPYISGYFIASFFFHATMQFANTLVFFFPCQKRNCEESVTKKHKLIILARLDSGCLDLEAEDLLHILTSSCLSFIYCEQFATQVQFWCCFTFYLVFRRILATWFCQNLIT